MLFDAPLQMKFHEASRQGRDYDMSQIFTDTLVEADPFHAVTLVANHDTQPLQALEAPVEPWFKPLAYALILLRENGVPSVFYPDLYGGYRRSFSITLTVSLLAAAERTTIPAVWLFCLTAMTGKRPSISVRITGIKPGATIWEIAKKAWSPMRTVKRRFIVTAVASACG